MNGQILDKWMGKHFYSEVSSPYTTHGKSFALHILTDVLIRTLTRFPLNALSHAVLAAWWLSAQTEPVYPVAFAEPAGPVNGPGPGPADLRRW